jgi:hypothetical protein
MDWCDDMVVTWVGDMKWHVEMENTLNPRIWPPWKEEVAYMYLIGVRCLLCLQSIYHLNVYKLQACVELISIPPTLQGSMGNWKPLVHANLFNEQKICIQERFVSTTTARKYQEPERSCSCQPFQWTKNVYTRVIGEHNKDQCKTTSQS